VWHAYERREIHVCFWWVNVKERDSVEDLLYAEIGGTVKTDCKEIQIRRGWAGLIGHGQLKES
jgi:hypothetical protein